MDERFLLHPWAPDTHHTTTEQTPSDGENIDTSIEIPAQDWKPITPTSQPRTRTIHFVDGARRHDAAGTFGNRACLFASIGVGSVTSTLGTRVTPPEQHDVTRVVLIAGDAEIGVKKVTISSFGLDYLVRPVPNAEGEPQLAAEAQTEMLRMERTHAKTLADTYRDDLVIVDGPLRGGYAQNVLGYVKTAQRELLPEPQRGVTNELRPGQRTPIYLVRPGGANFANHLEWVIRPRHRVPGVDPRLGLVRIQAHDIDETSDWTLDKVREIADWSAATLPEYSTDYHHDSRAPQQLLLIKNLENDMRRTFGNRELLQSALRDLLA